MTQQNPPTEDRVISLLHKALDEADPVPMEVIDYAKAAFSWRTIEAELAHLAYDSSAEAINGVRSTATARMLSFETGERLIDVEYNAVTYRLMGQIEPARIMPVELHLSGSVVATQTDDLGRFLFEGVLPGPVAMVFRLSTDEVVKTEWIVL
jgi:hypothetical protein